MGSKGVYTSRIFGEQYSSGGLRGALEERIAKVSTASQGSMEVALAMRAREERRRAFFFALAKNAAKVHDALHDPETNHTFHRINRTQLINLITRLLGLSWSTAHVDELVDDLDDQLSEDDSKFRDGWIEMAPLFRAARAELIEQHGRASTRRTGVANQAMWNFEERWRKKNVAHLEAHASKVIHERAEADRHHREQINMHHREQRERLRRTHENQMALAVEQRHPHAAHLGMAPPDYAPRAPISYVHTPTVPTREVHSASEGALLPLASSVSPSNRKHPSPGTRALWSTIEATLSTSDAGGAPRTVLRPSDATYNQLSTSPPTDSRSRVPPPPPPTMRVSTSLPALPERRDIVSRGQWTDQVNRLKTPALATTRLSPSRSRARDLRGVRSSATTELT